MELTDELASRFARLALGHLTREYPNKLDHVLCEAEDLRSPRELHPAFFGSFDWHSCVHGYWLLATLLRITPNLRERLAVRALLDGQLTEANIAGELAYLERSGSETFERPYGWAWLLALAAELARHNDERARRWSTALAPLARAFAVRFRDYLPRLTYPVRAGTHANTAFALAMAWEYARADDPLLTKMIRDRATEWFGSDEDYRAWEPSGEDFLSPALIEAECMRRNLPDGVFATWLQRFLPQLFAGRPEALFRPAHVADRRDGRIAHLDGLNLSRAWCFRSIARALEDGDRRGGLLETAARTHLDAALPHLSDTYAGEHWLATFALLAVTPRYSSVARTGGGVERPCDERRR